MEAGVPVTFRNDTELTFRLSSPTFVNVALDTDSSPRPSAPTRGATAKRVLKAARAVFPARAARPRWTTWRAAPKVGVGTVYRHFPTKEALLEALAREQFERARRVGARGGRRADDPWAGARGAAVARRRACRPTTARSRRSVAEFRAQHRRAGLGAAAPAWSTLLSARAGRRPASAPDVVGRRHPADDVRHRQRDARRTRPDGWRRHLDRSCSTACAPRAPADSLLSRHVERA